MKSGGVFKGKRGIVQVWLGRTFASTGAVNELTFDNLPSEIDGCPVAVRGLYFKGPTVANAIAAATQLDGVSMSQLYANIGLTYSPAAPPARAGMPAIIQPGFDGYRALTGLSFLTRQPLFPKLRTTCGVAAGGTGADSLTAATSVARALVGQRSTGWLQDVGAFGVDLAAGANYSDGMALYLPLIPAAEIGRESDDASAVPASWLNGKPVGSNASLGSGKLTIGTLVSGSGTIDNVAATMTGTTCDVWADVVILPRGQHANPVPFAIEYFSTGDKQYRLPNGRAYTFLSMIKQLTGAGAMQLPDYTTIQADCDGIGIDYFDPTVVAPILNARSGQVGMARLDYGIPVAYANTAVGRYTGAGIILIAHDGPRVLAPIGPDSEGQVRVITTGETTFTGIHVSYLARTQVQAEAAADMAGIARDRAVFQPATRNGNRVPPAIARLLAARLSST